MLSWCLKLFTNNLLIVCVVFKDFLTAAIQTSSLASIPADKNTPICHTIMGWNILHESAFQKHPNTNCATTWNGKQNLKAGTFQFATSSMCCHSDLNMWGNRHYATDTCLKPAAFLSGLTVEKQTNPTSICEPVSSCCPQHASVCSPFSLFPLCHPQCQQTAVRVCVCVCGGPQNNLLLHQHRERLNNRCLHQKWHAQTQIHSRNTKKKILEDAGFVFFFLDGAHTNVDATRITDLVVDIILWTEDAGMHMETKETQETESEPAITQAVIVIKSIIRSQTWWFKNDESLICHVTLSSRELVSALQSNQNIKLSCSHSQHCQGICVFRAFLNEHMTIDSLLSYIFNQIF